MSGRRAAPNRGARPQWVTALLVGEGHAEEAWLRHLKGLYAPRGSGVAVTIRNARGKGAAHVVDYAIRQTRNAAYDRVVAVLDTDTDWSDVVRKRASQAHIDVIACIPCLEVLLLQVAGVAVRECSTSVQIKQRFELQFGAAAHEPRIYEKHFGREQLDQARLRLEELDRLLRALTGHGR